MKDIIKIGKASLVMDYYSGEDNYSDGDVEDFLLETVKSNGDIDYTNIIMNNPNWAVLYHLSLLRENIIDWYPFMSSWNALEIGAGCGALTGCLTRHCKDVDAVELSKKRCLINAYRHSNLNNLKVYASNFCDFAKSVKKQYSLITLIGVLEYSKLYINSSDPFVDLLKIAGEMLEENGVILIAIENRLGLKYFAGCREDHLGTFFSGIEGYSEGDNVRTFSKKELSDICNKAGFPNQRFYYPYPDYKFPEKIYSDDHLPNPGELVDNLRNYDQDRYVMFDERHAFDGIISANLFPEFSNSFLVEVKR